jgi:hypothetical protein
VVGFLLPAFRCRRLSDHLLHVVAMMPTSCRRPT